MTLDIATTNPLTKYEVEGRLTPTRFDLTGVDMDFAEAELIASYLGRVNRCSAWWIGDLFAYSESRFGEEFAQLEAATGLHADTITRYAGLAVRIPHERRLDGLSVSHHQAVQNYAPEIQERMLTIAYEKEWSSTDLKTELSRVIGSSRGATTVKKPAAELIASVENPTTTSESTETLVATKWFVRIGPFDDITVAETYAQGLIDAVGDAVDVTLEEAA